MKTNQYKYREILKKKSNNDNTKSHRKKKEYLTEKVLTGFPHLTAEELGQYMSQYVPPNCRSCVLIVMLLMLCMTNNEVDTIVL